MSAHYLDHAATTPVRPEAAAVHAAELARGGNPSSLHAAGRAARRRLEEAREELAAALGAEPAEVIFTSGGTEADNLAVKGTVYAHPAPRPRLLVSAIEHHAVLDAAGWLDDYGLATGGHLPATTDGVVDLAAVDRELGEGDVALLSVMWANNETGVVQPIEEVVARAAAHGVPVHTDAAQAVGHLPVDFARSGVDALTVAGHKLGAPIGTGALLARRGLAMAPVHHGGGQERGVRSGTLDVAGACALARAVSLAVADQATEAERLRALRDLLESGILAAVPDVQVSGARSPRLPQTCHVVIAGADADALLIGLDLAGIFASAGSACQAGVQQPSHVLVAMGHGDEESRSGLRFSLGRPSRDDDIDAVLTALPQVVVRARAAAAAGRSTARTSG